MFVKPTVPGSVIRFPSDHNRRLPDGGCDVPETGIDGEHFARLLRTRELTSGDATPTGREPVTPLTTR